MDGYVTALGLDAAIADLNVVHVKSIQAASGTSNANLSLHSVTAQNTLYVGSGQSSVELISNGVTDAVTDLQIAFNSSSNIYTLQKKTISNKNWTDVDTFSRATSLSGAWGGSSSPKTLTVTASPQGATYEVRWGGSYADGRKNLEVASNGTPYVTTVSNVKMISVPIKVQSLTGTQSQPETVYETNVVVSKATLLESARATANGYLSLSSDKIGFSSVYVDVPLKVVYDPSYNTGSDTYKVVKGTESSSGYDYLRLWTRNNGLSSGTRTVDVFCGSSVVETLSISDYSDGQNSMGVEIRDNDGTKQIHVAESSTKGYAITRTLGSVDSGGSRTITVKAGSTTLYTDTISDYSDGFDAGNANRASQITGFMTTSDSATGHLSAGQKYKFQSQYKKADGTWANGGTVVVDTPANNPGTVTVTFQSAVGAHDIRAGRSSDPIEIYSKLNGTTKVTSNVRMTNTTYVNSDGDTDYCVDLHVGTGTSGTRIGRISTQSRYNKGYSDGYSDGAASVTPESHYSRGTFYCSINTAGTQVTLTRTYSAHSYPSIFSNGSNITIYTS